MPAPLAKAEKMPETLKNIMNKTILRVVTFKDMGRERFERELIFHRELLKISDYEGETGNG